ncbi:MAG TPA: alkaline phosphatase, partial [Bacteroidales bacterium]|nr:alkaline phosphatase [Bacteroidales bacterium]
MYKPRYLLAVLVTLFIFISCCRQEEPRAKYVFYFVGDGMGLAQAIAAEAYQSSLSDDEYIPLSFRRFPVTGLINTYAANQFTTGSAAAGTALATGNKTSINRIGLDPEGKEPFQSIALKAKNRGMKVGIISSVSIDHATPAAFYAHQPDRNMYFEIGLDLAASSFDFFGGGGFLKPDGIVGGDSVNLYALAIENGYRYINTKEDFHELKPADEKVLFVNPRLTSGASMYYAIDQPEDYITLADLTSKAIEYLDNENGFL